jgi:hypothetical protein
VTAGVGSDGEDASARTCASCARGLCTSSGPALRERGKNGGGGMESGDVGEGSWDGGDGGILRVGEDCAEVRGDNEVEMWRETDARGEMGRGECCGDGE